MFFKSRSRTLSYKESTREKIRESDGIISDFLKLSSCNLNLISRNNYTIKKLGKTPLTSTNSTARYLIEIKKDRLLKNIL